MSETLRVACLRMRATADVFANRDTISRALPRAAAAGVQVLLTPECALCGYPGAVRSDLSDVDTCQLADSEDLLHVRAQQHDVALGLGSVSPWQDGWSNDLLVCGAGGEVVRYRKRRLTPWDERCFHAGGEIVVVERSGWRLGLGICFDIRFPEHWQRLARAGADALLCIAHLAGPDPDERCKRRILPAYGTVRASEWATPFVLCNSAAEDRWLDSAAWDARGLPITGTQLDDLSIVDLQPRDQHDPWYDEIHRRALAM